MTANDIIGHKASLGVPLMVSFERVRKRWKAVIRRKGYPKKTKTFDTKCEAAAWWRGSKKISRRHTPNRLYLV